MAQAIRGTRRANWIAGILSVAGIIAFAYSLMQMTQIQAQMNHTMNAINSSVEQTTSLVGDTAIALKPLQATTQALQTIEDKQKSTAHHLASMNNHLRNIGTAESLIVQRLDTLNQSERGIDSNLSTMAGINSNLLVKSQQSVTQARTESSTVNELNSMTATSIAELHKLNGKLSALRLVP